MRAPGAEHGQTIGFRLPRHVGERSSAERLDALEIGPIDGHMRAYGFDVASQHPGDLRDPDFSRRRQQHLPFSRALADDLEIPGTGIVEQQALQLLLDEWPLLFDHQQRLEAIAHPADLSRIERPAHPQLQKADAC